MDKPKDIAPLSTDTNPYLNIIETAQGKMRFLNLKELLGVADQYNFGVLAANAVVPEMVYGVLDAAFECNSPVIIEAAESQIGYALPGQDYTEKLTRFKDLIIDALIARVNKYGQRIPICLHIDHLQKDPEIAYVASKLGYTSVELDFSKQSTTDRTEAVRLNIAKCAPIIDDLHALGISVEVEEGEIGSAHARSAQSRAEIEQEITKVDDATLLVAGANPEALAVFIGAAHGEMTGDPPIFYSQIGKIRAGLRTRNIDVPVVLHGGTGQTYQGFNEAVRQGARKFNYATRFWTILYSHLQKYPKGISILEEMEEAAKKIGRSSRYVWVEFAEKLYDEIQPEVFQQAQNEIRIHACELMEEAYLSKGMASHYPLLI
jgi:fructose-bisphosphate aldolase class II